MPTVTLSIGEELPNWGRSYARVRGTSLNSLVRMLLLDAVSTSDASGDFNGVKFKGKKPTATEPWPDEISSIPMFSSLRWTAPTGQAGKPHLG